MPEYDPQYRLPCAKVLGGCAAAAQAFRPASVVNISGMSFGSLSGPAVEALNRAPDRRLPAEHRRRWLSPLSLARAATSSGRSAPATSDAGSSTAASDDEAEGHCGAPPQIRAIEIKLSQGAKPGSAASCRGEDQRRDRRIRGIPRDRDCVSPAAHTAFGNEDGLLDFAEAIADETGLPVGIKSAVGDSGFWNRSELRQARAAHDADARQDALA